MRIGSTTGATVARSMGAVLAGSAVALAFLVGSCDEPNPAYLGVEDGDAAAGGSNGQAGNGGRGGGVGGSGTDAAAGQIGPDAFVQLDTTLPDCTPAKCQDLLGAAPCGQWECRNENCAVICANCADQDLDGFGQGAGCAGPDCDDNDKKVGANAQTACYSGPSGTVGKGVCRAGQRTCVGGNWGQCTGQIVPSGEACNNQDDDCNAQTDDNLGTFACGLGVCVNTTASCMSGQVAACAPRSATSQIDGCGNGDEDCDGAIDEDCDQCVRVAPNGDDSTADGSQGAPFGTLQEAIKYAALDGKPKRVCAAGGTDCNGQNAYTYKTADGQPLNMVDGVSVYGNYQTNPWRRCPNGTASVATNTIIEPHHAGGVVFPGNINNHTILDGFQIKRFDADASTAVTVDGAKSVILSNLLIPAQTGRSRLYGINIINGGDATVARSSIWAGAASIEAIGVRAVGAKVAVQDNCRGYDSRGRCNLWCGDSNLLGVRGQWTVGPMANESYAVLLQDAAGSRIEQSALCTNTANQGAALRITGASDGVLVHGSYVSGAGGLIESHGIWAQDCGGAAPRIVDNFSIDSLGRAITTRVSGVFVAGDCHAVIENNALIHGGAEGAASETQGVYCAAGVGNKPSRCAVLSNQQISGSASGNPPRSIGVRCEDGSCVRIAGNKIDGGGGVRTNGIWLGKTGAMVQSNLVVGGCGTIASAAVHTDDSFSRLENNILFGSQCETNPPPISIGLEVLLAPGRNEVDVHSNLLDGGSHTAACTSVGVDYVQGTARPTGPLGLFRNNIVRAGACNTKAGFREGTADTDPRVLENNDFDPAANAVLYLNENATALTLAQINGLMDARSMNNISVNPMFQTYPTNVRLQTGSMCIDTGTTTGEPPQDAAGNTRGANPDIGPYEQ